MLSTIWTWTQEWSDIPSRSEVTWAMCHQARSSASALTPSSSASRLRLPRVGARTLAPAIASAGVSARSPGPAAVLSASFELTRSVSQAWQRNFCRLWRVYIARDRGDGKVEHGDLPPHWTDDPRMFLQRLPRGADASPSPERRRGRHPHDAVRPAWNSAARASAAPPDERLAARAGLTARVQCPRAEGKRAAVDRASRRGRCRDPAQAGEAKRAVHRAPRGDLGRLRALSADDDVGCIVLTGAGPAFCSGMDTSQFGGDLENRRQLVETSTLAFEAVGECRRPIVAAVNGPAIAGGFALALLCDLRIASTEAVFGYPELPGGSRRATPRRAPCCRRPWRRSSA